MAAGPGAADQCLADTPALAAHRTAGRSNIRLVVVGILVFWVAAIFASFGLNAPRNATVVVAFLVCALSIGCAVFLILEMDSPFQGVLRLSKQPMTNALAHMQL
jgi:hypothetical protein